MFKPLPFVRGRAWAAALAVLTLASAGCQAGPFVLNATPTAATVNGHRLTQAAVTSELKSILANASYVAAIARQQPVVGKGHNTFDLAFTDRVLTRQIFLELIHEEVVRRRIALTPSALSAAADDQRAQIGADQQGKPLWNGFSPAYQALLSRRAAEVTALQTALGGASANADAVKRFYDDNAQRLFAQSCASHILVPTEAEAASLRAQIDAGGDFAALATQFSKDSASAAKGGDLGCAPAGSYVAAFDQAVQALGVGELSQPVKTQFGYHVIKVTDRKVQPFEAVRAQIVRQLSQADSQKLSQYVQDAVGRASVSINPRYGTFERTGPQAGVVPPHAPSAAVGNVTATTLAPPLPGDQGAPGGAPPTSTP